MEDSKARTYMCIDMQPDMETALISFYTSPDGQKNRGLRENAKPKYCVKYNGDGILISRIGRRVEDTVCIPIDSVESLGTDVPIGLPKDVLHFPSSDDLIYHVQPLEDWMTDNLASFEDYNRFMIPVWMQCLLFESATLTLYNDSLCENWDTKLDNGYDPAVFDYDDGGEES